MMFEEAQQALKELLVVNKNPTAEQIIDILAKMLKSEDKSAYKHEEAIYINWRELAGKSAGYADLFMNAAGYEYLGKRGDYTIYAKRLA